MNQLELLQNLGHTKQAKLLGTAIGDMNGSKYEWWSIKSRDFEICGKSSRVTDDTVMTCAVAEALLCTLSEIKRPHAASFDTLLHRNTCEMMRRWGTKYPHAGYGGRFRHWLRADPSDTTFPTDSFGNGAAMRIGPVGFLAQTEEQVRHWSRIITATTHNSVEGIKAAEATALAVFYLLHGIPKDQLLKLIEEHYYPLDGLFVDQLHETYDMDVTCQGTMPAAFTVFFESDDFETAMRNTIYIGGDTDTIGAIVGTWAQIIYPIPNHIVERAVDKMDSRIKEFIAKFDSNLN